MNKIKSKSNMKDGNWANINRARKLIKRIDTIPAAIALRNSFEKGVMPIIGQNHKNAKVMLANRESALLIAAPVMP
jgi:hypothetical protein